MSGSVDPDPSSVTTVVLPSLRGTIKGDALIVAVGAALPPGGGGGGGGGGDDEVLPPLPPQAATRVSRTREARLPRAWAGMVSSGFGKGVILGRGRGLNAGG